MAATDLTGRQFGHLIVVSRDFTNKSNRVRWFCKCDCGKVVSVIADNLVRGRTKSCGCHQHKSCAYDLTGHRFGQLFVISRAENQGSGHYAKARWNCLCDCGRMTTVTSDNLMSGNSTSCGCKPKKIINDISGKRFGLLIAKSYVGSKQKPSGQISSLWLCECDCGNKTVVSYSHLATGHTTSCGCSKVSHGELFVSNFLNAHNIDFKSEYVFDDLLSSSGCHLRFDFAIFKLNILVGLIEVQGLQHYEPVSHFGGVSAFDKRKENDRLKYSYCKTKSIPLLLLDVVHTSYIDNLIILEGWLNSIFDEHII